MVRSRSSLPTRTMGNSQQGGNPSKRQRGRAHECRSHNLTETVSTEWEITGQSASEKSDSQPGIYRYRRNTTNQVCKGTNASIRTYHRNCNASHSIRAEEAGNNGCRVYYCAKLQRLFPQPTEWKQTVLEEMMSEWCGLGSINARLPINPKLESDCIVKVPTRH